MQYYQLKKKKYRWLITGVSGFIGSNLLDELLRYNQKVIGVDNFSNSTRQNLRLVKKNVGVKAWNNFNFFKGDINNLNLCETILKNVDFVLHQAARGSVQKSINDPIKTNASNINAFLNVLTISKKYKIKSFVYASSGSVYGDSKKLPKIENKTGKVLSNYGLTKKVNEEYAELFYKLYKFKTIGLRYFNVFGKYQSPNGDYAAVIPRWINKVIKKEKLYIYGDGKTTRDFCPVKNVIQANILAALSDIKPQNYVYNVGTNSRISLNQLIKKIYTYLKIKKKNQKIKYKDFRKGDIRHSLASIKLITKSLAYKPDIDFSQGLEETIDWFSKKNDK